MQEVFEQAMIEQDWLLDRQLDGFLNKQLTGLDQAVTDILIRQKSITVGSDENETIIDRPLKAEEIQSILSKPCDDIILDIFTKRYRKCSTKKYRSSLVFDPFVVTGSLLLEF